MVVLFTYILGTYVLRILIAILDTPFIYISKYSTIYFVFQDGSAAGTACIDYGKEFLKKYPHTDDHMQVYLDTKEYSEWLRNEAWK